MHKCAQVTADICCVAWIQQHLSGLARGWSSQAIVTDCHLMQPRIYDYSKNTALCFHWQKPSSRHCNVTQLDQWPFAFSPGFHSWAHMLSHFHPLCFAPPPPPPPHGSLTTFHPHAFTTLRRDQTWLFPFSWLSSFPPLRTVSPCQIAVRLALVRTTENTSNCNCTSSFIVLSQKFNPEPLFL